VCRDPCSRRNVRLGARATLAHLAAIHLGPRMICPLPRDAMIGEANAQRVRWGTWRINAEKNFPPSPSCMHKSVHT